MKRSAQEIVELVVFGLIALLLGTGLLWLAGWLFGAVGTVFSWLAGLIWALLRFIVPVALIAAVVVLVVRLVRSNAQPGASAPAPAPNPAPAPAPPPPAPQASDPTPPPAAAAPVEPTAPEPTVDQGEAHTESSSSPADVTGDEWSGDAAPDAGGDATDDDTRRDG
jgi:predicted lipid-binding transport protein (Tim44 family)